MSTSEVALRMSPSSPNLGGGLLMSELGLVLRRRRNIAMLVALGAVPIIVGVALRIANPSAGDGPPDFITQVTGNGMFLGFVALIVVTPFLWPLTMSVVSGSAVAAEASEGTLRYLLTLPVARWRVLIAKYIACVVYGFVGAVVVIAVGFATGALLFPVGEVTLLSGTTIGGADMLVRAVLVAGFGTTLMAGVAAIGMFISTLTEVPIGAMAAAAAVPVVSNILGAIPQLEALHPWLLTDTWPAYGDILRDPIDWDFLTRGVWTQVGYIVIFLSLGWARLTSRDITS